MINIFATLVTTAIFAVFAVAVNVHFCSKKIPPGMKVISFVSLLTLGAALISFSLSERSIDFVSLGLVAEIAGLCLFAWAVRASGRGNFALAYDDKQPAMLVRDGPYRFIRHPFYMSYCLFWLGCTIATCSIYVLAGSALLCLLYYRAARREERQFAASPFGTAYARYAAATGVFWPKGRRS